jgi:hypothetical protein
MESQWAPSWPLLRFAAASSVLQDFSANPKQDKRTVNNSVDTVFMRLSCLN